MKKNITKQLEGTLKEEDGKFKGNQESKDRAVRILNARAQGKTLREIADDENVSYQRVQQICTGYKKRGILPKGKKDPKVMVSFRLERSAIVQLKSAEKKIQFAKNNAMPATKEGRSFQKPPHTSRTDIVEDLIEQHLPDYLDATLSYWKSQLTDEIEEARKQLVKLTKTIGDINLRKLLRQTKEAEELGDAVGKSGKLLHRN